jgi:hypothetical protein
MEATTNKQFRAVLGASDINSLPEQEVPPLYAETLEAGWIESDGSWFLSKFRDEYHGSKSQFTDHTGYESAVNGRSIPDADATSSPLSLTQLAVRGITFARDALSLLPADAPPVTAYVSVGYAAYDEAVVEGNVTFCADHDGEPPYITDLDSFEDGVMAIRSAPGQSAH